MDLSVLWLTFRCIFGDSNAVTATLCVCCFSRLAQPHYSKLAPWRPAVLQKQVNRLWLVRAATTVQTTRALHRKVDTRVMFITTLKTAAPLVATAIVVAVTVITVAVTTVVVVVVVQSRANGLTSVRSTREALRRIKDGHAANVQACLTSTTKSTTFLLWQTAEATAASTCGLCA